jgi:hypothetical protein
MTPMSEPVSQGFLLQILGDMESRVDAGHTRVRESLDMVEIQNRVVHGQIATLVATSTLQSATLTEIKVRLDTQFVTREVFDPIRNLVYGQVGLILIAVAGYVLSHIFGK